ncbi:hypothetical protein SBOR_7162 [Sclerotinia borealis F-4128]|uniref:Uncharacterized protein n=1 Tax=Sclerotinia borealis (strain F-4128) TaxID=1432307 RepID=W9CD30_SCLBF|nr:hypothetical protein SBOR_7162 [Sclerotinia borealis F-4128]
MHKVQPLINSIPEKLQAITSILVTGSSISYFSAISLGRKSSDVCSTIYKAIAMYEQGFTPTQSEAEILLEAMTEVVELTEKQLSLLAATKPVFDKLWITGVVRKNTTSLGVASAKLSEVMSRVEPEYLREPGRTLEDRRKVAFEKTVAVYGNGNAQNGEDREGQGVE